jgi:SAM-dependent methyltransferase
MWLRRRASTVTTTPANVDDASASGARSSRTEHGAEAPSPWVVRFAARVAPGATVLDVACGRGRHARLFAEQGCLVEAVDVDAAAGATLAEVERIRFLCADLEDGPWPYAGRGFDAVVVTNYLHRPLFARLAESLNRGGVLIYETFVSGHERFGRPTNPAFLLAPRELLETFGAQLSVLAFEEGVVSLPRPARVSRICAVRASAAADAHLRLDAHC